MKHMISIAGSDSLAAAGIQQDIRAAKDIGIHCSTVITTLTAQNHQSCKALQDVGPELILAQFESITSHERIDAIKVGMISSQQSLICVVDILKSLDRQIPIVYDPIMATSSGSEALDESTRDVILNDLLPLVDVVTPNLDELAWLTESACAEAQDIREACLNLIRRGAGAVLAKGGHGEDQDDVSDYLCLAEGSSRWITSTRLDGSFRGTGCYLSTAIAGFLAKGDALVSSVIESRSLLMQACNDSYLLGEKNILRLSQAPQDLPKTAMDQIDDTNSKACAPMDQGPIGLYPVLPNTEWLKRLVPLGLKTVQLRIKDASQDQLRTEITEAIRICEAHRCRLFINDYWQLAIELGAYGVHLGQEDLDQADIYQISKSGLRLGISTHSVPELSRALALKPSYVALGPIFPTTCKSMAFGPQGIARIKDWVRLSGLPVVAIGGLKLEHAKEVLMQEADGIALISNITENQDPESKTKDWIAAISD
ncbi:MAG: thiamine phosphate synthase [Pseudobacteriovorax sp.]|nr:thiamine phosphate synthase [Pseudobacteriovorax sp.]